VNRKELRLRCSNKGSGVRRMLLHIAAVAAVLLNPSIGQAASHAVVNKNDSVLVLDYDTGQVLYDKDPDATRYPASLTKMMTLYLLFDAIERGEVNMDTVMKVSKLASSRSPTKLGVKSRSTIKVADAINALIILSANDVATVISEHLSGTERDFAAKMTDTAHQLGMSNTVFQNASGLPNILQVSTARDFAILSVAIMHDFPQYYSLFSQTQFDFHGIIYRTHNHILSMYKGSDGIKTGFINASGFNIAASAIRDGHRIIVVTFGGPTAFKRDHHVVELFDYGFSILSNQSEIVVK